MGVDPGLRVTGYGVIEASKMGPAGLVEAQLLEAGVIRTETGQAIAQRLSRIHRGLHEVIAEHRPQVMAIEKLYAHYKHPATAILMGHARGVVCLAAGLHGVRLVSVASTHVKKSVTGAGHAGKAQVQRMVQKMLGLKSAPEPADVTDALAVAIACASQMGKGAHS